MKHRLSLVAALVAYLMCVVPAMAADESPASAPQISIEELRARLKLTPDQQAKIAPYVEERKAKMEPVRAKLGSATSRREKLSVLQEAKAIQDDFNAKVQPVLTEDQQAEWQKIRAELREQMKERRRKR
jgi:hypothetical protein